MEPSKCAWCGKAPKVFEGDWYGRLECTTANCPSSCISHGPAQWDAHQARILAARRRDFGAGYLSCSNGSFVLGEIDGKWRDYVERRDDLEFSEHGT